MSRGTLLSQKCAIPYVVPTYLPAKARVVVLVVTRSLHASPMLRGDRGATRRFIQITPTAAMTQTQFSLPKETPARTASR